MPYPEGWEQSSAMPFVCCPDFLYKGGMPREEIRRVYEECYEKYAVTVNNADKFKRQLKTHQDDLEAEVKTFDMKIKDIALEDMKRKLYVLMHPPGASETVLSAPLCRYCQEYYISATRKGWLDICPIMKELKEHETEMEKLITHTDPDNCSQRARFNVLCAQDKNFIELCDKHYPDDIKTHEDFKQQIENNEAELTVLRATFANLDGPSLALPDELRCRLDSALEVMES
jgi:hypothetical protein